MGVGRRYPAWGAMALLSLALAACGGPPRPRPIAAPPPPVILAPPRPQPSKPVTAIQAGVRPGPAIATLPLTADGAVRALAAFRTSCRALLRRIDASGLARPADWQPACSAAKATLDDDAPAFFATYFETAIVGDGRAFATGYYEPEIEGSRTHDAGYDVPVYARPRDLVEIDPGAATGKPTGKKVRGRMRDGVMELYPDRAAIENGALAGQGLEIAWAKDPLEFFFLQIQGSGRLHLPDGTVMRIGYDGQNGRDYTGIGRIMRDRGLIGGATGFDTSMQGMMAWMRGHPDEARLLMQENKSFVFFRELTGAGPIGALGVPVTGHVSVAADPAFIPLGAPLWLTMDRPEVTGLWVAQDTGGAIKGANRVDTFWGAGIDARVTAGGMSARGQALILLPVGTLARLSDSGGPPAQR